MARFREIVQLSRERFGEGGPFLFGAFSAADAMFAPICTRLHTYSMKLDETTRRYVDAVLALPAFRAWQDAALRETWIVGRSEVDEAAMEELQNVA